MFDADRGPGYVFEPWRGGSIHWVVEGFWNLPPLFEVFFKENNFLVLEFLHFSKLWSKLEADLEGFIFQFLGFVLYIIHR